MTSILLSAFLLGLIFNAAPGAVFAETVKYSLRGGFKPALYVQLGSLLGDAIWAALGLLGIGLLFQLDFLKQPLLLCTSIYLLWLARDAWLSSNKEFKLTEDTTKTKKSALYSGATISLINPHNIAYWAALGSAMSTIGIVSPTTSDYAIFFTGFMLSSILWTFFCAAFVSYIFRNSKDRWTKYTYRLCALLFMLLALFNIQDLLTT